MRVFIFSTSQSPYFPVPLFLVRKKQKQSEYFKQGQGMGFKSSSYKGCIRLMGRTQGWFLSPLNKLSPFVRREIVIRLDYVSFFFFFGILNCTTKYTSRKGETLRSAYLNNKGLQFKNEVDGCTALCRHEGEGFWGGV